MTNSTTVISALLSTGLISLAPNLILFLFPNYGNTISYHHSHSHNHSHSHSQSNGNGGIKTNNDSILVLSLGQALAAGGLLGDVFLHMLPHCIESSSASGSGAGDIGIIILFGFVTFMIFDVLARELSSSSLSKGDDKNVGGGVIPTKGVFTHTVILNLAADALHNFMDGIAIGTSYATSHGHVASISILLHEIPHELGDFAILVKAGFSKRQAIMAQFGTAVAAFLGTIVGLAVQLQRGNEGTMIGFTAGSFLYLACVGILPEVLEGGGTWTRRIAQILAFSLGLCFMYAVAMLEHHEEHGRKEHHGHSHHSHSHHHQDL